MYEIGSRLCVILDTIFCERIYILIEHCASEIVKIEDCIFSRKAIILNKVLDYKDLFGIDNMRSTKS